MTHLVIVGASARAAAYSAIRAGWSPLCVDLFADRDLAAVAPVTRFPSGGYPDAALELLRALPPAPWVYTGGLENHAELVGRIAAERELLGNGLDALRRVRDPFALTAALSAAGLPVPGVRCEDDPPDGGRWLRKPLASAGGAGIALERFDNSPRRGKHYLQQFIDGEPHAAIYVVDAAGCRLFGVTRQLVGVDWLHAKPFHYCGSIGPAASSDAWVELGQVVADFGGLRGVFGIDAIVADGVPWPVEVNPRYTASVEVVEAVTGELVFSTSPARRASKERAAKGFYFAPADLTVPASGPWDDADGRYADIPWPGDRIAAGRPVMTLSADDELGLRRMAADLDWRLFS